MLKKNIILSKKTVRRTADDGVRRVKAMQRPKEAEMWGYFIRRPARGVGGEMPFADDNRFICS